MKIKEAIRVLTELEQRNPNAELGVSVKIKNEKGEINTETWCVFGFKAYEEVPYMFGTAVETLEDLSPDERLKTWL